MYEGIGLEIEGLLDLSLDDGGDGGEETESKDEYETQPCTKVELEFPDERYRQDGNDEVCCNSDNCLPLATMYTPCDEELPEFINPTLVKVVGLKHLAFPVPNGGGRRLMSHVAATGTH